MDFSLCFIKEKYFIDNSNFVKKLDPGNSIKQSKRTCLCLQIKMNLKHICEGLSKLPESPE